MDPRVSPQEQTELTQRFNSFNLDTSTRDLALQYFIEYKSKNENSNTPQLSLLVNCAILAASKSQVIHNLQGDRVKGIGLSITQVTRNMKSANDKSPRRVDEFLAALKDFIHTVTLNKEVAAEMKEIIDKFAFSYTFYKKYENICIQIGFKEEQLENGDYLQYLKNFGWLLYVNAKTEILQGKTDLVDAVSLLVVILGHMLQTRPSALFSTQSEGQENKEDVHGIYQKLYALLKLENVDNESISYYETNFTAFLNKLFDEHIIKRDEHKMNPELYSTHMLIFNFNKLEAHYQKTLSPEDLDERFFIHKAEAHTPGKFTPFARQGAANKIGSHSNSIKQNKDDQDHSVAQDYQPFRSLNYEVSEKVTMKTDLNEIKFATKCIPPSPYTRLMPAATPMTRALEMINWLNDKAKSHKTAFSISPRLEERLSNLSEGMKSTILPRANTIVGRVLSYEKKLENTASTSLNEKKLKDYYKQAVSLYLRVLEDLFEEKRSVHSRILDFSDESFHKALIAASIETVFFVNNSTAMKFETLLKLCDLQAFDFWKVIASFVSTDPHIPYPVKKHFGDLELKIVLSIAWKKDSTVHQIIKNLLGQSKEGLGHLQRAPRNEVSQSHEIFFKRVLHITASQVQHLTDLLRLGEDVSERVWTVMKYILSSETSLLIQRHIDQFLLCSVYGVCKATNKSIKFQEIITKYQELPSFNKSDFSDIIHQVYINETERADLISFYNAIYIAQLKPFIFSSIPSNTNNQINMVSATPFIKRPLINALFLESPLRESLAPNAHYDMTSLNRSKSPMVAYKNDFTPPLTSIKMQLQAQNAARIGNINNMPSKRQIDFNDIDEDFLMKKPKLSNPIVGKIVDDHETDMTFKGANYKRKLFEVYADKDGDNNTDATTECSITSMNNSKLAQSEQTGRTAFMNLKLNIENFDPKLKMAPVLTQALSPGGDLLKETDKKHGPLTPEFGK